MVFQYFRYNMLLTVSIVKHTLNDEQHAEGQTSVPEM